MKERMRRATVEEAVMGVDQEVDQKEGGVAVGSAGSDELEAKTQENPHPNPTSQREKRKGTLEMSLRYGIIYERWSVVTPQVWMTGRRVQVMSKVYVMTRAVASQRKKTGDMHLKKLVAVKATKWTWRRWQQMTRKSCGGE